MTESHAKPEEGIGAEIPPLPADAGSRPSRGGGTPAPIPAGACDRWHRTAALVGLPGMPNGPRPIRLHGARRGWRRRQVAADRRGSLEWLESSLPAETQAALREARGEAECDSLSPISACPALVADSGRAAVADARADIVAAFDRYWRAEGGPLVAALRRWAGLYAAGGAPESVGVSAETMALVPAVAWNTLQRWRNAMRSGGVSGLLPGAGGRLSGIDADPALVALFEAILFANPHHTVAGDLVEAAGARFPDRVPPSISQARRWVRRWRAANAPAISAVADPDGHRSASKPAFGSRSAAVEALNQLWELDSTTTDVMCADGRRYALIAAIDVWSRRVKVTVAPTSKAAAIAALVRRCLLDWGVPATVRTDNGKDYTSKHLRRVFLDLGVEHDVVPPFSPDKKPFIERFIGTLGRGLFCRLEGFTGHNVAQAERLRSRKAFSQRRGDDAVASFRCGLTAEELQGRIDAWCDDLYARRPHGGLDGQSPFERAASWAGDRRRPDERALDILLAEAAGDGTRVVWKDGIKVDGGIYIAAELGHWMRQRVHVRRDPADWGRIFVFSPEPDTRFICIAEDPVRTGIDRETVAARAVAIWNADNRKHRKRARGLAKTQSPETVIDEVLARAAADAERVVAFPAKAADHSTGALDAARAAQDAADAADAPEERRVAAGGGGQIADIKRYLRAKEINNG